MNRRTPLISQSANQPISRTAVIYTRVSSKEQVQGTSLDTQLAECSRFAERSGYTVEAVYTDAGLSAKTADDRPQLQAALKHCAGRKTNALIVWKVDRLSRNTADGIIIRESLRRIGCEVVSATEGFSADPMGDAMSSILLTFAQLDNAQRAIRCRTGMEETAMRGGWCHKAPEGFDRAKSRDGLPILKINDTGRALQVILRNYAAGRITKTDYYCQCESIGISARKAERIPHREIYAGIIRETLTGGQPVHAAFPGLVTLKELHAMQRKTNTLNRRGKQTFNPDEKTFKGLVKCACGRALTSYKKKGHLYYKCSKCGKPNIRDAKLYELIAAEIKKATYLSDLLFAAAEYARRIAHRQIDEHRKIYAAQEREAKKANARLDRLTDLYIDGKISEEVYNRKSDELTTIIQKSNSEKTHTKVDINERVSAFEEVAQKLANPTTFIYSLPPEKAHAVLEYIFGSFELSPEKQLSVKSNFSTPSLHTLINQISLAKSNKKGEPPPANSCNTSVHSAMVDHNGIESNFAGGIMAELEGVCKKILGVA